MSRGRCSPEQREHCPLTKHFSDTHHWLWPKSAYTTKVEREYRELPENKEQLCRNMHNEIHATQAPPEKPSREVMLQAIAAAAIKEPHVEETDRPPICEGRPDAFTGGVAA